LAFLVAVLVLVEQEQEYWHIHQQNQMWKWGKLVLAGNRCDCHRHDNHLHDKLKKSGSSRHYLLQLDYDGFPRNSRMGANNDKLAGADRQNALAAAVVGKFVRVAENTETGGFESLPVIQLQLLQPLEFEDDVFWWVSLSKMVRAKVVVLVVVPRA